MVGAEVQERFEQFDKEPADGAPLSDGLRSISAGPRIVDAYTPADEYGGGYEAEAADPSSQPNAEGPQTDHHVSYLGTLPAITTIEMAAGGAGETDDRRAAGAGKVAVAATTAAEAPPPADSAGGGNDDEPPGNWSLQSAPEPDDGDKRGEQRRNWRPTESRPKLQEAAALLEKNGIQLETLLHNNPALRGLCGDLVDGEKTIEQIAVERGLSPEYVRLASGKILDRLLDNTPQTVAEAMPQPTGALRGERIRHADPTGSVGGWLNSLRQAKGTTVKELAAKMYKAPSSTFRLFHAQVHPSMGDVNFILAEFAVTPEIADQVRAAYRAEKAGDMQKAQDILAGLPLPQPEQEDAPPAPRTPKPLSPDVVAIWAPGQLREALRSLDAALRDRGADLLAVIPENAQSNAMRSVLPLLLKPDLPNAQIAQEAGVEENRITRWAKRLLAVAMERLPEDVAWEPPEPRGRIARSKSTATAAGEVYEKMREAGITQDEVVKAIGVSPRTVVRLLNGHAYPHPSRTLIPLIRLLRQKGALDDKEVPGIISRYEQERRRRHQGK